MGKGGVKPPFEVKNLRPRSAGGFFLSHHVVAKKFSQKNVPFCTGIFSAVQNTYPFSAKTPPPSDENVPMSG